MMGEHMCVSLRTPRYSFGEVNMDESPSGLVRVIQEHVTSILTTTSQGT